MEILASGVQPTCGRMSAGPIVTGEAAYPGISAGKIRPMAAGAVSQACFYQSLSVEMLMAGLQPACGGVPALVAVTFRATLAAGTTAKINAVTGGTLGQASR